MARVSTAHKRVDIRRNDTVKIITGRDKGKEGRVLRVFPNDEKILVEHVMATGKSACARSVERPWTNKLSAISCQGIEDLTNR